MSNIFERNSAVIQIEKNRLNTKADLGAEKRSFGQEVAAALQAAADKARELANDFFDTKAQEQTDRQNGDTAAVQNDRAAEAQDRQEYRQVQTAAKQEMTVGEQVARALNSEASQVDRFSNQEERQIKNNADPARVEDQSNAQSNLAEEIGKQIQDKGTAQLNQAQNFTEQLVPRGVDGGVGTGGFVTIGNFMYDKGSFQEPTAAGQFSTTAHMKNMEVTSTTFNGELILDNSPNQLGNAHNPPVPQHFKIETTGNGQGIYNGTAQDVSNEGTGGIVIPMIVSVSSDGRINFFFQDMNSNVKAQFEPVKKK
jgi:hypothetical protein